MTDRGRWCVLHGRTECTKHTKRGADCHHIALKGLDACRLHAGMTTAKAKAKGEAYTAFQAMGADPNTVSPNEVMARVLHVTFLRWALLAGMLEDQVEEDTSSSANGTALPGETGGLIGYTFGPAGITGEAARGLATLEAQERERAAKFAKLAHDMGIADREIQLAESQASIVVNLINTVLTQLGLTTDQAARVPDVVSSAMRQLELIPGEVVT